MIKYALFKNKKNQSLVYYPCAKNACTSTKLFFAKHCNEDKNYVFTGDQVPEYLQTHNELTRVNNLVNFIPNYQPFKTADVDIKCCIIRDPIKRFLSAYKNRILFHKDVSFRDHSVDMILEKLSLNQFENSHFLPQTYVLGKDLGYYTFYSDVTNIKYFEKKVNEFFSKKIEFPNLQTGGYDYEINLTKKQISLIEKIYSSDFELYQPEIEAL